MSNREIYLDHAATTPVDPVVADTISRVQADCFANPSSPHRAGRRAHHILDESRVKILEYFDCPDATLIFTSGATEANYLAVHGLKNPEQTAFGTSQRDHESLRNAALSLATHSADQTILPLDENGCLCKKGLRAWLLSLDTSSQPRSRLEDAIAHNVFLSTTLVCGQTGAVEDVLGIQQVLGDIATRYTLHVDATQAVGKIPVSFPETGATSLAFTPHKFGGPRGIGCLIIKKNVEWKPLFSGSQQLAMRGGTEPVALIAGCREAAHQAVTQQHSESRRLAILRESFESTVCEMAKEVGIVPSIICQNTRRSPHLSTISFPGIDRQAFMMAADLAGLAVATGTACASNSIQFRSYNLCK
jgi:cysteine desulfurase